MSGRFVIVIYLSLVISSELVVAISQVSVSCDVANDCHPQAQCVHHHLNEAYACVCNLGFDGDGYQCSEIELTCKEADICHLYATCTEVENSDRAICICNEGYQGDGTNCQEVAGISNLENPRESGEHNLNINVTSKNLNFTDDTVISGVPTISRNVMSKLQVQLNELLRLNTTKTVPTNHSVTDDNAISETSTKIPCTTHDDCPSDLTCAASVCEDLCKYMQCGVNAVCRTTNHIMACHCLPGFVTIESTNAKSGCQQCNVHSDCEQSKMCVLGQCEDVCRYNICGPMSSCKIKNNHLSCKCLPGYIRYDSYNITSACQECYVHDDCPGDKICISSQCVDTCRYNICGQNATCSVIQNQISCECLPGYSKAIPNSLTSPCKYDILVSSEAPKKKSFYFVSHLMNHTKAAQFCKTRGDSLATLLTEEDNNKAIAQIPNDHSKSSVWLGGICSNHESCYWLGSDQCSRIAMDFTYFHVAEPNSNTGGCLQFWMKDGSWKWDDNESCSGLNPFLCETFGI